MELAVFHDLHDAAMASCAPRCDHFRPLHNVAECNKIRNISQSEILTRATTERFLKSSPPSSQGISEATSFIRSHAQGWPVLSNTATLIGVAGTLTTLASIDLALPSFDRERVHKHMLTLEAVDSIFNVLRTKGLEELKQVPQILPERADIILAGILILLEVMKQLDADSITVSDRGLRYGILMKEVQKG